MKLKDITIDDFKNIVAVISIAIGMFIAIAYDKMDLSYVLAGALSGIVVGSPTKHITTHNNNGKDE